MWESTDLINWGEERLVVVEDETAGMVWAPEAIWDPEQGWSRHASQRNNKSRLTKTEQYLVYWASKFVRALVPYPLEPPDSPSSQYSTSDPNHTGSPSNTRIRYAYTADFTTFTAPQTLIDKSPTDIIDLTILPVPSSDDNSNTTSFLRFMKDETLKTVFVEVSTTGLFGTWTRPGGDSAIIQSSVEGPAAYWDNTEPGKAHLLLDFYGGDGYQPFESTDPGRNDASGWTESERGAFPSDLRHGSVLPVGTGAYEALRGQWS